jgi:hypothetical protein
VEELKALLDDGRVERIHHSKDQHGDMHQRISSVGRMEDSGLGCEKEQHADKDDHRCYETVLASASLVAYI